MGNYDEAWGQFHFTVGDIKRKYFSGIAPLLGVSEISDIEIRFSHSIGGMCVSGEGVYREYVSLGVAYLSDAWDAGDDAWNCFLGSRKHVLAHELTHYVHGKTCPDIQNEIARGKFDYNSAWFVGEMIAELGSLLYLEQFGDVTSFIRFAGVYDDGGEGYPSVDLSAWKYFCNHSGDLQYRLRYFMGEGLDVLLKEFSEYTQFLDNGYKCPANLHFGMNITVEDISQETQRQLALFD